MSEDLKPCPFCGCEHMKISPNIHTQMLRVQCEGCWATSVTSNNRVTIIAAWNRRASHTPPTTEGREEREGEREEALELARYLARRFEEDGDARNVPMTELMLARALLSSPRVEAIRREALEEAAKVAERGCLTHPDGGSPTEPERELCEAIARDIRALTAKETEG